MLAIRNATADDAAACSTVLCASIRALCAADHGGDRELVARWTANKTPHYFVRWMANPDTVLLLAERDGAPAGVGAIARSGEVLLNYVAPEHRFCGVSRALLAHMEDALRAGGVRTATLTSTVTARRFYRAAGWTDAGEPQLIFGLRGFPMAKAL